MIQAWIESIFLKRTALAIAAGAVALWTAHQAPAIDHMAVWGIHATITIDQKTLADHLTVLFVGLSQGFHEWVAVKYPLIGKYI